MIHLMMPTKEFYYKVKIYNKYNWEKYKIMKIHPKLFN